MKFIYALVVIAHWTHSVSCHSKTTNIHIAAAEVTETFMKEECQHNVPLDSSLKVTLAKEDDWTREIDCLVTFSAKNSRDRLMISFEKVSIDCDLQRFDRRLRIYDGVDDQAHDLTGDDGICDTYDRHSQQKPNTGYHYKSSGNYLTLSYWGTPTKTYDGFTAIITVLSNPDMQGNCDNNSFQCSLEDCIPEELQCNGYTNCFDEKDEERCINLPDHNGFYNNKPGSGVENISMLVGGSVSILILMIVTVWLGIVCVKRMITKREIERTQQMLPAGPVIDADNVPPFIPQNVRPRPPPLQPPLLEAPPLYSAHTDHGHHGYSYDLPPPYTPDGCDTSELLPHTQGLSLDTPPAYQTIDPNTQFNNSENTYLFPTLEGQDIAAVHSCVCTDDLTLGNADVTANNESMISNNREFDSCGCQVGSSIEYTAEDQQEAGQDPNPEKSMKLESQVGEVDINCTQNSNDSKVIDNVVNSVHSNDDHSSEGTSVHFYRKRNHFKNL